MRLQLLRTEYNFAGFQLFEALYSRLLSNLVLHGDIAHGKHQYTFNALSPVYRCDRF